MTSKISEPNTGDGNNSEEDFDGKSGTIASNNDKAKNNKKVKVYPNPNNGTFTLTVTNQFLGGEIMIFDTYGKKMYLKTIKQNRTAVNQQLERGVYFVAVIKGNNKLVEKIVIQ